MKTTTHKFDKQTNTVSVTFDHSGVTFMRDVNACLTPDQVFDKIKTQARIEEVALGVAAKIEAGIIKSTIQK